MNNLIKKIMTCAILILTAGICYGGEPTDGGAVVAGRDDPFAGGFGDVVPQTQPSFFAGESLNQTKPPLFVRTVTLKFLKAANLKNALDKMSTEYGSIGVDDNTNSLIVCDTNDNLGKILTEIKQADQTPRQIMIEVVIVDVQLKDDTEIGVDWDLLTTENKDFGYRQSMIFPGRLSIIEQAAATTGDITAFRPVGLGSELSVVNDDIRNVVNVLQEKRKIDILASPRVMVVSGQKAEIKTVTELPYIELAESAGGSLLQSAQFKNVGVTLTVKATLTADEKIVMEVSPQQSVDTGTTISNVPVVDTRGASTTLIMDDGQVVVIGGLRKKEIKHIRDQVPLLGDIPIIGILFSNDKKVVENSELLLLLSPHIYKNEPVPAGAMARFNQAKDNSLLALQDESKTQPSKQSKKDKRD